MWPRSVVWQSTEMASISDEERRLFLEAVTGRIFHGPIKDTPVSMQAAKKRKKNTVDARLDLHGLTREAANFRLRVFIERCVQLRKRRVLIIHGKGSGALREEVRQILAGSRDVILISDAPPKLGGDGAVLVEISVKTQAD